MGATKLHDSAKGRQKITLKRPDTTRRKAPGNCTLKANSMRNGAIARPVRGYQVRGLGAMALRFIRVFCHAKFSAVRKHYVAGFEVVNPCLHFSCL